MALGVASHVGVGAVLVNPEQAASTKVPLDAPEGALEHGADLARLQVRESLPARERDDLWELWLAGEAYEIPDAAILGG